jgi:hypothetical protein
MHFPGIYSTNFHPWNRAENYLDGFKKMFRGEIGELLQTAIYRRRFTAGDRRLL